MKISSICEILKKSSAYLFGLILVSCNFSNIESEGLQPVNNLFLDQVEVNFSSARLQITGPASVTGPSSHISMLLELSTDENFSSPKPLNTNILNIPLLVVNEGINFPDLSLTQGNYQVSDPRILEEEGLNPALESQDLLAFPTLFIQYLGNDKFQQVFIGNEGRINLQFDVSNDLVRITHNWETGEGRRITGLNTLPLNLSAFRN